MVVLLLLPLLLAATTIAVATVAAAAATGVGMQYTAVCQNALTCTCTTHFGNIMGIPIPSWMLLTRHPFTYTIPPCMVATEGGM